MNLRCFNILLWTASWTNDKVTNVCNLCEMSKSRKVQKGFWCFQGQANSPPPSPAASTRVESHLETVWSVFLPKPWWGVEVLWVWAFPFQTGTLTTPQGLSKVSVNGLSNTYKEVKAPPPSISHWNCNNYWHRKVSIRDSYLLVRPESRGYGREWVFLMDD